MSDPERIAAMEREIESLRAENSSLRRKLTEARNPDPIDRPSLKRVKKLVSNACCGIDRVKNKWRVWMGKKERFFKRLRDVWEFFLREDWALSDLFPPPKPKPAPKPVERSRCKYCESPILWIAGWMGKMLPHDEPGKRHRCAEYYRERGEPLPLTMLESVPF
jgi:hypothetical protein